jgi:hypothetical protein
VLKLEGGKFGKSVRGTDMSGVLINHVIPSMLFIVFSSSGNYLRHLGTSAYLEGYK